MPAGWAGVVALICVALTKLTPVTALPPMATVAVTSKFVPVMVIAVPPWVGPEAGLTAVTVGGGGAKLVHWPPAFAPLGSPPLATTSPPPPPGGGGVAGVSLVPPTTTPHPAGPPA